MKQPIRVIISGGGTGGHIFPAISIANALKECCPETEFLFVGAVGRMEMTRVPAAGYKITGLPVRGFDRKNLLKNLRVLYQLAISQWKARRIIKNFAPHVVVGVGGYASGPTLKMATSMGIPALIQEQNSYAGVTNKLLAKKAHVICVAYQGMERFFPAAKIRLTGNPIRQELLAKTIPPVEARAFFGLDPSKKTLLVIGGSLGARVLNQSIMLGLAALIAADIQLIWQTGTPFFAQAQAAVVSFNSKLLVVKEFIQEMDQAYAAADLVISRAGAGTISELCLLKKAVILVPSPNVAEDHQTKNALALTQQHAALLVADKEAMQTLIPTALSTLANEEQLITLQTKIATLAHHDAANIIATEVLELAKHYQTKHGTK